ncbi:CPBP family intramembrane glutamic endopeptidase [Lederbergia galactosidilytica]|nr:CPBP family intramembrane glutamic endopeptidase [Lederbergia galactosidilytica]MBP1916814.1 membrane protease YdiL (CAAX protease family) [Lederbergia galactosidilytica]
MITRKLGMANINKTSIYVWGFMAVAVSFLVKEHFVYNLPALDRQVLLVCLALFIVNMVMAKYSGYKPIGVYNTINFVIFYPLFEEVVFRGLILPILNQSFQYQYTLIEIAYLPVTIAVVISAFLFAIAHLQYYKLNRLSIRYMCFAFIGGILFGAIADYTQSIFLSVLLHIEFNFLSATYAFKQQKVQNRVHTQGS